MERKSLFSSYELGSWKVILNLGNLVWERSQQFLCIEVVLAFKIERKPQLMNQLTVWKNSAWMRLVAALKEGRGVEVYFDLFIPCNEACLWQLVFLCWCSSSYFSLFTYCGASINHCGLWEPQHRMEGLSAVCPCWQKAQWHWHTSACGI